MNLKHLEYFVAVAEAGNITAAARELRMTQPALSRQIATFEEEMGWKLLERGARSIQLTHAGEVVLKEGKALLGQVDKAIERMRRSNDGGVIRVGYAPSLASHLLRSAMSCFAQRHSQVAVHLADMSAEEMRTALRKGKIDLMVGAHTADLDFSWATLERRKWRIALPEGDPLYSKRKVNATQLDGRRLLLLSRLDYPEYWQCVSDYFSQHGINAKVAGEFDGISSLGLALEAGLGAALLVEGTRLGDSIKLTPLDPAPDPVCVAVGWRSDHELDPITAAFVAELKVQV